MSDAYVTLDVRGEPVGARRIDAETAPVGTLVAIHGASFDHHVFDRLLPLVPAFDRWALDLPGRGASAGAPRTSVAEIAEVVGDAIDAIAANGSRAPVVVLGHSFGGAVAIELAIARPDHVDELVLLSTGARLRVRDDILASYAAAEASGTPVRSRLAFRTTDEALVDEALEHASRVPPRTAHADWRVANSFDRLRDVARITARTRVVCGTEDTLTPLKYAEHLVREIPHAALTTIAGEGHMAVLEAPDAIATILRSR